MNEYMVFLRGGDARMAEMTEAEIKAHMDLWGAYMGQLGQGGNLLGGLPLAHSGRLMCNKNTVEGVATLENGQSIGGWLHLKARDYDHAIELTKGCPIFDNDGNVEIREVVPMEKI